MQLTMEKGDMTTEDKFNCIKNSNPSELIVKIMKLVEHQVTKDDIARHTGLIMEYVHLSQNGMFLSDLFCIMQIIETLKKRMDEVEIYNELLGDILCIGGLPPLMKLSSDVLTFNQDLKEYFSLLGFLILTLKYKDHRFLVCYSLINLLTSTGEFICCCPLRVREKAVENSLLPEILGQLLILVDDKLFPEVLRIVSIISNSKKVLEVLLKQDSLNSLFARLEPTWRERYPNKRLTESPNPNADVCFYEDISKIIWSLLKHLEGHQELLNNIRNIESFSLWNIQYVFKVFSASYTKNVYRNDILAIIINLIYLFPKMDFVYSGLANDLLVSNVLTKPWNDISSANVTETEFNFHKLLLVIIPLYVQFEGGLLILEDMNIMYKLLTTIRNYKNPKASKWPSSYIHVINIITWKALRTIIPYMEEEFIENSGIIILLDCFKLHNTSDEDLLMLDKCLDTIHNILKHDNKGVILESIIYNDGVAYALGLCENFLKLPVFRDITQNCIQRLFCIMIILCQDLQHKYSYVVDIVVKYMLRFLKPSANEPVYDNRIIICLMDFVWKIILPSKVFYEIFLKKGGVYHILDITEKYPFHVKLISLGVLVDLSEDDASVPYLITWRGKSKKNITAFLMEIFRYENQQLEVRCDSYNRILDPKHPLMGEEQRQQTYTPSIVNSNPAMSDLFLSCRPKVYALLQLLNDRHEEKVKLANEYYRTYNEELDTKDQITMLVAGNFFALKLNEAWNELLLELKTLKFHPTHADLRILKALTDRAHKWGKHLQEAQAHVFKENVAQGLIEEITTYNQLGEARIEDALNALCELKYIARCTERMFRISQKYMQFHNIEKSLAKCFSGIRPVHKTYSQELRVTPVFQQNLSVKSNVIYVEKEEAVPSVSPDESEMHLELLAQDDLFRSVAHLDIDPY